MEKVTSADGTTIGYERLGTGPRVILVGGALCDRNSFRPLATELARDFDVVTYDRRGRGDSGDSPTYAVQREVDDLGALLTAIGGTAAVYGHSSGAALAAIAASTGLPFTQVVLHEPPYGPDDGEPAADAAAVLELLAAGRRREAVERHLIMTGMPAPMAREYAATPGLAEYAPTLAYDYTVLGMTSGSRVPVDVLAKVTQPTLVVAGSASPPFMVDSAQRIVTILPAARYAELADQHHVIPPDILAPVLHDFLSS